MEIQFYGIYIGGEKDRSGKEGLNYGMTGIFTKQHLTCGINFIGPIWSFVPDGSNERFTVFFEDIYRQN